MMFIPGSIPHLRQFYRRYIYIYMLEQKAIWVPDTSRGRKRLWPPLSWHRSRVVPVQYFHLDSSPILLILDTRRSNLPGCASPLSVLTLYLPLCFGAIYCTTIRCTIFECPVNASREFFALLVPLFFANRVVAYLGVTTTFWLTPSITTR